jgi:hypothetical protein
MCLEDVEGPAQPGAGGSRPWSMRQGLPDQNEWQRDQYDAAETVHGPRSGHTSEHAFGTSIALSGLSPMSGVRPWSPAP